MTREYRVQKTQCPSQDTSLKTTGSQTCTTCRQNAAAGRRKNKTVLQPKTGKAKKAQTSLHTIPAVVRPVRRTERSATFSQGFVPEDNDAVTISRVELLLKWKPAEMLARFVFSCFKKRFSRTELLQIIEEIWIDARRSCYSVRDNEQKNHFCFSVLTLGRF